MKEFIFSDDVYKMNWVEGNTEWGTVKKPKELEVTITSKNDENTREEEYVFKNTSDKDVFTSLKDISIYVPFNDDYKSSDVCITNRCHTHIWCGGDITYVMALRMGGDSPHLGLVLTEGSIGGYSVERDFEKMSNDRGDFIFHPSPVNLAPRESFKIKWKLFRHEGKEDFYEKLKTYCKRYIGVKAENYVVFEDERIHIEIEPAFDIKDISIMRGDDEAEFYVSDNKIVVDEKAKSYGEYSYKININNVKTKCNVLVLPTVEKLAYKRCRFITEKQQYHNENSALDGAYLIYDNEEKHIYYNSVYDYNAGRERIGMGLLIAKYLQYDKNEEFEQSLKKYICFVERELFNEETGEVYNDYKRDNSYKRLYNYPWMSLFYLELFDLYGEEKYLTNAYKIMKSFYEQGGAYFYAIEIPLLRISKTLINNGMNDYAEELKNYFIHHCEYIIENGLKYPAHEVNYEQSIAAPACNMLIQMYMLTKEKKYLAGAKEQMKGLESFNGLQPDYHMYEVAVRHWDGYWFGKRKMYGDTYPHYWSALTARAYRDFGVITENSEYEKKSHASHRGVLSLINPDGSASCAYVYPVSVNGEDTGYYDVYANDQDWGLYFMFCSFMDK